MPPAKETEKKEDHSWTNALLVVGALAVVAGAALLRKKFL